MDELHSHQHDQPRPRDSRGNRLVALLVGLLLAVAGLVGLLAFDTWLLKAPSYFLFAGGLILALTIGHLPNFVIFLTVLPFVAAFEALDQRPPARRRRKARKLGYSAVGVRDVRYYVVDLGCRFRWWTDEDGDVVLEDAGAQVGKNQNARVRPLGTVCTRALVVDIEEKRPFWEEVSRGPNMECAPSGGLPVQYRD